MSYAFVFPNFIFMLFSGRVILPQSEHVILGIKTDSHVSPPGHGYFRLDYLSPRFFNFFRIVLNRIDPEIGRDLLPGIASLAETPADAVFPFQINGIEEIIKIRVVIPMMALFDICFISIIPPNYILFMI